MNKLQKVSIFAFILFFSFETANFAPPTLEQQQEFNQLIKTCSNPSSNVLDVIVAAKIINYSKFKNVFIGKNKFEDLLQIANNLKSSRNEGTLRSGVSENYKNPVDVLMENDLMRELLEGELQRLCGLKAKAGFLQVKACFETGALPKSVYLDIFNDPKLEKKAVNLCREKASAMIKLINETFSINEQIDEVEAQIETAKKKLSKMPSTVIQVVTTKKGSASYKVPNPDILAQRDKIYSLESKLKELKAIKVYYNYFVEDLLRALGYLGEGESLDSIQSTDRERFQIKKSFEDFVAGQFNELVFPQQIGDSDKKLIIKLLKTMREILIKDGLYINGVFDKDFKILTWQFYQAQRDPQRMLIGTTGQELSDQSGRPIKGLFLLAREAFSEEVSTQAQMNKVSDFLYEPTAQQAPQPRPARKKVVRPTIKTDIVIGQR